MPTETFRTSDIALAAYLLTSGYRLQGVEAGRPATFVFDEALDLSDRQIEFVNGQATVEPSSFLNNLKNLKAMANGY